MGVDSGLPDFRGDEGFWKAYPPFRERNLSFVDLADPVWFGSDPQQAWGFYGHRLLLYRQTDPHEGFQILRRWAEGKPHGGFVFTSNVDGHFQKAGFPEDRIVECHGTISMLQCSRSCTGELWSADDLELEIDAATFRAQPPLPQCPRCQAVARPNILMFGDGGWVSHRTSRQERRYQQWLSGLDASRLVVVECGAGTAVPTVRYQSQLAGGVLVRINPREPAAGAHGISLPCGALEALRGIAAILAC